MKLKHRRNLLSSKIVYYLWYHTGVIGYPPILTCQMSTLRKPLHKYLSICHKNPLTVFIFPRYEESVVDKFKSNLLLMIFCLHIINYNS
jgi:hypothetical protein